MTPTRSPRLVSLLGPSGSGKTTLATALIARWKDRGRKVGYAKHASHGFEMDLPGKDTFRATEAGAAGVAVTGPRETAYLERVEEKDPRRLAERFFPDADVVLFEGFRAAALPAVLLVGGDDPVAALETVRGPLLAIVVGDPARVPSRRAPVFAPDQVAALADHLESALAAGP